MGKLNMLSLSGILKLSIGGSRASLWGEWPITAGLICCIPPAPRHRGGHRRTDFGQALTVSLKRIQEDKNDHPSRHSHSSRCGQLDALHCRSSFPGTCHAVVGLRLERYPSEADRCRFRTAVLPHPDSDAGRVGVSCDYLEAGSFVAPAAQTSERRAGDHKRRHRRVSGEWGLEKARAGVGHLQRLESTPRAQKRRDWPGYISRNQLAVTRDE